MAASGSFDEKVTSLMFLIVRNLKKKYKKYGEVGNIEHLSIVQLEALKFIGEQKNPLMKDVANHLSIAAPSLTPIIDELEKKKLIKRGLSKNDRRAILIFMTKTGKDMLNKVLKMKREHMQYVINKLTKCEQKTLIKILEKLSSPAQ